jgi:type I restriction enzyme S subunit
MPPSQFDISWDDLRLVPIPATPLLEQQAIAEYLDTETARIDALIAKKRRMINLLGEKRARCLEAELEGCGVVLPGSVQPAVMRRMSLPSGWRASRLGSILRQLTNGYVGPTRDILRDSGVRYIQGLHIKGDRIDFNRRHFYVDDSWHQAHSRTALRPGDVLIVQTGDIGRCAVVPPGFGEANCHALLIARPNLKVVMPEFLGAYLQSQFGYRSLIRVATGALHPHLEFGIRDVPIVVPPIEVQAALVEALQEMVRRIDSVVRMIERQIELSVEHRQALITATVTGELEVTGVAA